jgi:hypothetical protein
MKVSYGILALMFLFISLALLTVTYNLTSSSLSLTLQTTPTGSTLKTRLLSTTGVLGTFFASRVILFIAVIAYSRNGEVPEANSFFKHRDEVDAVIYFIFEFLPTTVVYLLLRRERKAKEMNAGEERSGSNAYGANL